MGEILHRVGYGAAGIAGAALAIGALMHGDNPEQHINSVGKDTIEYATLHPGNYCDVRVGTEVAGTSTTLSWIPSVAGIKIKLGPVHAPHETLTQSMSGPMESEGCFKVSKAMTAKIVGHTVTFNLPVSSDPETTGFSVITYPKDYESLKFTDDGGNWVKRIDDATVGQLTNEMKNALNVLPFMHLGTGEGPKEVLMKTNLLVGAHYVAIECGKEMAKAVTASHDPGENAVAQMLKDLSVTKGASVTDIKVNLIPDKAHPGAADQYADTYNKVMHSVDGLSDSTPKVPQCTNLVTSLGHASH